MAFFVAHRPDRPYAPADLKTVRSDAPLRTAVGVISAHLSGRAPLRMAGRGMHRALKSYREVGSGVRLSCSEQKIADLPEGINTQYLL